MTTLPFAEAANRIQIPKKQIVTKTLSANCEIETKLLVRGSNNDFFDYLILAFSQRNMCIGDDWTQTVISHYFDTGYLDLYKASNTMRIRHQPEREGNEKPKYDISAKGKATAFGKNGSIRLEPEVKIDSPRLDLASLYRENINDSETTNFLISLCNLFDNNARNLRETMLVECPRTTLNVALYIVEKDGKKYCRTRDQLNGDAGSAKLVPFEFALDRPKFTTPNGIFLREDVEIEYEFKKKPCEYGPSDITFKADESLTEEDIVLAQSFLMEMLTEILNAYSDNIEIIFNAPGKNIRGTNSLIKFYENNGGIAIPDHGHPTIFGKNIPFTNLPSRTMLAYHRPPQRQQLLREAHAC